MNATRNVGIGQGRRQAGLSIVELMVAVAIGLFMMAGFTGSFLSMKRSFVAQDKLAELQDTERLALSVLTNTVRAAGYYPVDVGAYQAAETALPADSVFKAGQGIVGTNTAPAQTLSTRYVANDHEALTDCLGQTNTSGAAAVIVNTYSISPRQELLCSLDGGATTTPLVGNVKSFSVMYGVDSAGVGNVDRYITADQVSAALLWPQVKTVQISVSFINPYASEPGEPATVDWMQTINLMNRI